MLLNRGTHCKRLRNTIWYVCCTLILVLIVTRVFCTFGHFPLTLLCFLDCRCCFCFLVHRTKNVYGRVLKHSGDKVHRRIHPALVETLASARMVDLSSPSAVEILSGNGGEAIAGGQGGEGEGEEAVTVAALPVPPLDWLHPRGTSDNAKGVSLVIIVDPFSKQGLQTLEQVRRLHGGEGGLYSVCAWP